MISLHSPKHTMSLTTSCTTPFSPPSPSPSPSPSPTTAGSTSHRLLAFDRAILLLDRCESIDQILQTHAALLRSQSHLHPVLSFKLQRSYSSLGCLDYARSLFDHSPNPNVVSWSALIHAYTFNGLGHHALLLYRQVLTDGTIQPNAFTFSSVLKACSHLPQARAFHSQAIKFTFDSDPYVRTTLLDLYARGGDVDSAQYLFDTIPQRRLVSVTAMITCYAKMGDIRRARRMFDEIDVKDVVCWNVMIDGYTQHGRPNEALDLFREMLMTETRPNEVTFPSVLSACALLGALESGKWLHSYIKSNRIRLNVQVSTALIDMYYKCGSLEDACLVFDKIVNKDVVAWNSMITGYAMYGHSREALQLFSQMCSLRLRPTAITFIGVLSACVHAGLVEEGRRYFQSMKDEYGIEPEIKHYGCMVDLLGRAGFVEEAYELAKSMTIEQDPVLWGSLLASCRLHGYRNIGESIAKFLLEKGLANSGTYVLLSNIYAAEGKWDEVARVRTLMKDSGIQKEPGCSSIEVDNKTHEFLAGDLKHPRTKEIYLMLEELNRLLKAHGYVPQTEIVLLDIEESDKERALGVHSEKLAIAFGLISTQSGTPIRIVKNLRVCSDCHTVTKLISKITGRKIVVRDRNRFHHFVDGSCSCRDYW